MKVYDVIKIAEDTYKDLVTNIPEFNPEFLKATKDVQHAGLDFWWDNNDTKSRLDAFSVLKDIYKELRAEVMVYP